MDFLSIAVIAIILGLDTFSVGVAVGTTETERKNADMLRMAFSFGFFQFFMNVLGYLVGIRLEEFISLYDHWVVFLLLSTVGTKMILEGLRKEATSVKRLNPTKGGTLFVLSIATSIDALAVGLSFGLINIQIIYPSIIIGLAAFAMTCAGVMLGDVLKGLIGKKAAVAGGIILFMIGVKVVLEHT